MSNVIDHLGDEFCFHIITSDRDLDDKSSYEGIDNKSWRQVGKAKILYLSPWQKNIFSLANKLRKIDYDVLYLNGFFNTFTRRTLYLRWLGIIPRKPVVLAPRGEFSAGALRLKKHKKNIYIWFFAKLNIVMDILWQASSDYEKQDILNIFRRWLIESDIFIAPNLPVRSLPIVKINKRIIKESNSINIVFLSRIDRKKNLDYAINCLHHVNGNVVFDIYGPLEDQAYWHKCQEEIKKLPDNIMTSYQGVVKPEEVNNIFSKYHLFLFPTHGENFGHVILESLLSGCPVLISDQTPWRNLTEANAGWDIPLDDLEKFQDILNELISMDESTFDGWSRGAKEYGIGFIENPALIDANRDLFLKARTR